MQVLVIQNSVKETVQENLKNLSLQLSKIKKDDLDFIVFPEMFTTPYEETYFIRNKQDELGEVVSFLKSVASQFNAYVIGGSIPESNQDKLFNTTFIIDRKGQIITKYRKIHLFAVEYPNGEKFDESHFLSPGNQVVTFDTEFGKMGVMICFDIRFPELAYQIQSMGANVIFVPAAFNQFTGPLHWDVTFRSRAIDNQLFIVGSSPSNDSFGQYHPYGHSLVVDPYGKIIKQLNGQEGIMQVEITLDLINEVRRRIPIVKNQKNS